MDLSVMLPTLLGLAWLLPLASFAAIVFFGRYMGRHGSGAAYVACGAIITAFVLSAISMVGWLRQHPLKAEEHASEAAAAPAAVAETGSIHNLEKGPAAPSAYSGQWYTLAEVGKLKITIGYYIDALTVAMFCMVTLIASCIHVYSIGYMHEELHEVTDHEVTMSDGHHLHRPGRY